METQLLVTSVRENNGALVVERRLFFLSESELVEFRKKTNWVKDEKGRFAGSVPTGGSGGNSGLTNEIDRDIMDLGSDDVTISSIDSPIEQKHTGKGNPNAILIFDNISLNNRQQTLLDHLPEYDSRVTVHRDSVNMPDLSALTAKTGDEFACSQKEMNVWLFAAIQQGLILVLKRQKSFRLRGINGADIRTPEQI